MKVKAPYKPLETVPYGQTLLKLRAILKKELRGGYHGAIKDFPHNCCRETARLCRLVLGLEEVSGIFSDDEEEHTWNYDPKRRLYIDLTQDQFRRFIPPIAILPVSNAILQKIQDYTKFQRKASFPLAYDILKKMHLEQKIV